MGKLLKNLLEGARQVLVLSPGSEYIRPSKKDFHSDIQMLRKDSRRVVSDLCAKTSQYGK